MFDAIIFDCDGVLVDSEVLAHEVELTCLAEFGLDYDKDEFAERYMGMPNAAFHPALAADFERRTGRALPRIFTELHRDRMAIALEERLAEIAGAAAAVSACPVAKAVASSSELDQLEMKLRKVGLWPLFAPHVYSAESVAHGKPAPDLFLHAAAKLGVAPQRCLVVEDSVNGVRAGCAAEMEVWGFLGGGHCSSGTGETLIRAGASRLVADWAGFSAALVRL